MEGLYFPPFFENGRYSTNAYFPAGAFRWAVGRLDQI